MATTCLFLSCVPPGPAQQPVQLPLQAQPASPSPHKDPHLSAAHQPKSPPAPFRRRLVLTLLLHPSLPATASRHADPHQRHHSPNGGTHSSPGVQRGVAAPRLPCRHGDHQASGERSDVGGAAPAKELAGRRQAGPRQWTRPHPAQNPPGATSAPSAALQEPSSHPARPVAFWRRRPAAAAPATAATATTHSGSDCRSEAEHPGQRPSSGSGPGELLPRRNRRAQQLVQPADHGGIHRVPGRRCSRRGT